MQSTPLRSRRQRARYADKTFVGNTPVALIKSGGKQDFVTAEEFAEDLYGKPVDHIVFKEDMAALSLPSIPPVVTM